MAGSYNVGARVGVWTTWSRAGERRSRVDLDKPKASRPEPEELALAMNAGAGRAGKSTQSDWLGCDPRIRSQRSEQRGRVYIRPRVDPDWMPGPAPVWVAVTKNVRFDPGSSLTSAQLNRVVTQRIEPEITRCYRSLSQPRRGVPLRLELQFKIIETGHVKRLRSAFGNAKLDACVRKRAGSWRFSKPVEDGDPTQVRVRLRIEFERKAVRVAP